MNKLFISCPSSIDTEEVSDIARTLSSWGCFVCSAYNRKDYNPSLLKKADTFVFLHPNNAYKFERKELPNGVRGELDLAQRLGKRIFLAYKTTSSKQWQFYETNLNYDPSSERISGMPGTYNNIYDISVKKVAEEIPEIPHNIVEIDKSFICNRRLLLCL